MSDKFSTTSRLLLTPGPLTTSPRTRAALQHDWGSREADFIAMSEALRAALAALANVSGSHVAIPMQGSGTFAVEAAIGTLVPGDGLLLVLVNGAYGRRAMDIARRLGRACVAIHAAEDQPILPGSVAAALAANPAITDVFLVHCETTSGLLNPLADIAAIVRQAGQRLLIDAMSSFGAVPIDGSSTPFTALMASSNKGLEGVPGLGFVIAERAHLLGCAGNSASLGLDLFDQWRGFEADGQWRFTPPVQVVAGLAAALAQLAEEGGVEARNARYQLNCAVLIDGMTERGFEPFLAAVWQAPVIVTFRPPHGSWFAFAPFQHALNAEGIVIYPGKLTREPSFRIGCIGAVFPDDMRRVLRAVDGFLAVHRPAQSAA